MKSDFKIPKLQEYKIVLRKGMSFRKAFSITNFFGIPFDFRNHKLRGYYRKDNMCICPEIEFDVCLLDNCSKIEMNIDARKTEKLKLFRPMWFFIDLNPRGALEKIDRKLKISDVDNYNILNDKPLNFYNSYSNVEPYLEHPETYRLVQGIISVEL